MVLSVVFSVSPFLLIFGLIGLAVTIFCIVDIVRRPEWAWQASGQNKILWLVLTIVGHFLCWLIMDVIYLAAIRPKVVAAEQRGGGQGGGGGYGTPYGPQTYGTPTYGGGYGPPGGSYGSPGGPTPGYGAPGAGPASGQGYDAPGGYPSPMPPPPPPAAPGSPPPGWYPDPAGSGQPRYWDGRSWSSS